MKFDIQNGDIRFEIVGYLGIGNSVLCNHIYTAL